jgi:hypothetical protein
VGYRALEYATVLDGQGRRWLKSTFTNGVEPLFLLQALRGAGGRDPARRSGPVSAAGESAASSVVVFSLGAATAIQGTVDGFELMVIGRTSEAELLDLIESSRP